MSTARLIAMIAAASALAALQVAGPLLGGRLLPSFLEVGVGCAYAAAAIAVYRRERMLPPVSLASAAVLWAISGMSTSFAGSLSELAARASLLPYSLLVGVVVLLPNGRALNARTRTLFILAILIGTAAGTGLIRPALLLLGLVPLVAAMSRWRNPSIPLQLALGISLIAIDVGTIFAVLPATTAAALLGLVVVVTLLVFVRALERGPQLWSASAAVSDSEHGVDPLASRLAGALEVRHLRVAFPDGTGSRSYIDSAGASVDVPANAEVVIASGGEIVGALFPAPRIDEFLRPSLIGILTQAGGLARMRAKQRSLAAELDRSRHLLLRTADDERSTLQRRLEHTVGARINEIATELSDYAGAEVLQLRVRSTRDDLARFLAGADIPTDSSGLVFSLTRVAAAAGASLRVDIDASFRLATDVMPVVWFTCSEAIVNAAKHAPGAPIEIHAFGFDERMRVTITDSGPGGVRADGSGLRGLADRAADAKGTLVIASGDSGTRLQLDLPLSGFSTGDARDFHDATPTASNLR